MSIAASSLYARLPDPMKRWAIWANRHRPGNRIRWGNVRRPEPFSNHHGFDRGLPVDRVFVESFLNEHRSLIRGRGLEVKNPAYLRRYGSAMTSVSSVDIDPTNTEATIIADLTVPFSLPAEAFDCIVFTQVLQFLADDRAAIANLWQAIAPGGALLITVPTGGRQMPAVEGPDYRRYQPLGLEWLLQQLTPAPEIRMRAYGSLVTKVADVLGVAREELNNTELVATDDRFLVIAAAVAFKPAH